MNASNYYHDDHTNFGCNVNNGTDCAKNSDNRQSSYEIIFFGQLILW